MATIVVCLAVMLAYFCTAASLFNFHSNAMGTRGWFDHNSLREFLLSLPFGLWFMDGFEGQSYLDT